MTKEEAKERITKEFLEMFYDWLNDMNTLTLKEYFATHKWWCRPEAEVKDNQKSLLLFQREIFDGRYMMDWERLGYSIDIMLELRDDGFLSHKHYWTTRKHPDTDYFYISQTKAKEIYKSHKDSRFLQ